MLSVSPGTPPSSILRTRRSTATGLKMPAARMHFGASNSRIIRRGLIEETAVNRRTVGVLGPLADAFWQPTQRGSFEQVFLTEHGQLQARWEGIAKFDKPHIKIGAPAFH